jgi:hypothetical protein
VIFSTLSQAWNNRAKSMIPKMRIKRIGSARANSSSACAGLLPGLGEREKNGKEKLSLFIEYPFNG